MKGSTSTLHRLALKHHSTLYQKAKATKIENFPSQLPVTDFLDKVSHYPLGSQCKKALDDKVMDMEALDLLSVSVVKDRGF